MCYEDETHQKPHRYQMARRTVVYKLGERHWRQLPEWWMSGGVDTTHARRAKGCNCASANVPWLFSFHTRMCRNCRQIMKAWRLSTTSWSRPLKSPEPEISAWRGNWRWWPSNLLPSRWRVNMTMSWLKLCSWVITYTFTFTTVLFSECLGQILLFVKCFISVNGHSSVQAIFQLVNWISFLGIFKMIQLWLQPSLSP